MRNGGDRSPRAAAGRHVATITAITVPHVLRAARGAGVETDALVARLRLPASPVYEDRIGVSRLCDLWEAMVRLSGDPALPVRATEYAVQDERSLLSFACAAQQTVGVAFALLERYYHTATDAYGWTVETRGSTVTLASEPCGPYDRPGWRAHMEFDLVDMVRSCARFSAGAVRPLRAAFAHRPAAPPRVFAEALGFEPARAARRMEIVFPRAVLALPLPTAKPALAAALEPRLAELSTRFAAPLPVSAAVRALLPAVMRMGRAGAPEVARRLAVGRRTLERRLAEEGTSFRALLDETRLRLAREWLGAEVAVAEVAERLAYSDTRAFDRAFRRLTGTTPSSCRGRG